MIQSLNDSISQWLNASMIQSFFSRPLLSASSLARKQNNEVRKGASLVAGRTICPADSADMLR
jgi:hypothetical protein